LNSGFHSFSQLITSRFCETLSIISPEVGWLQETAGDAQTLSFRLKLDPSRSRPITAKTFASLYDLNPELIAKEEPRYFPSDAVDKRMAWSEQSRWSASFYDQYTRLIARHIGKYLPGNPTRVVENMPGAGGLITANHLYNRSKPDGLTIGAWPSPLILQQIMGNDAIKFDGRKVGWVGIPAPYDTACFFNKESSIRSMEDWINAKRPMKIGSIGPGTSLSDVPKLLKAALSLPLEIVEGYKGGAEARLGVENGEVDGLCASWQSTKVIWRNQGGVREDQRRLADNLKISSGFEKNPVGDQLR
jgi:hypothetical protein